MDDKRKRILGSSLELFVKKGFHGAPTAQIARNADVSNGTLFHYFRTKVELVQGLYQHIRSEQFEAIVEGIEVEGDPREQLHRIWKQSIKWAYTNREKYTFLHQYKHSPYKKKSKKEAEQFKKDFALIVERGVQQKQLRYMPADYVYEITMAHILGMMEYLDANPVKYRTPEFMKQSFEWFLQGLEP